MAKSRKPISSIEEAQDEMINLANDLARRQLAEGTATSPVITHFLQMGSEEYQYQQAMRKIKQEKAELENELLRAKTENLRAATSSERMYTEAMKAFGVYNGSAFGGDDDDDEDY